MTRKIVLWVIRAILLCLARVSVRGRHHIIALERAAERTGLPVIVAMNHINFLEIPIVYLLFKNRQIVSLAKRETWDTPVMRLLADLWETIPLHRGAVDRRAFERAQAALHRGSWILVAPEGTRSGHGQLQQANGGIVLLAQRTGAAVLPVAHYGGETVWTNLRRCHRTKVTVLVGQPLYPANIFGSRQEPSSGNGFSRSDRTAALTRIMVALARLMPAGYHGFYRETVRQFTEEAAGDSAPEAPR